MKNVDVLFNTVYNPTPGGRFIEIYTEPEASQPGRTRPTVAPGLAAADGAPPQQYAYPPTRCIENPLFRPAGPSFVVHRLATT